MKLELITDHKDASDSAVVSGGEALLQNWYISKESSVKGGIALRPTPGYNAVSVTPSNGTGCIAGYEIQGSRFYIFGDGLFKDNTKKADFAATPSKATMIASGVTTNRQLLILTNTTDYCYSITYETMWALDGTSTYNLSGNVTSASTDKLVDSGASFSAGSNLELGMTVHNTTDDTWAIIEAVDSGTQLSLSADIFPAGTEGYEIAASYGAPNTGAVAASLPWGAQECAFMDGYFIVSDTSSTDGRFYISYPYDCTRWSALDFATAERFPDNIVKIIVNNKELWLIGSNTSEIWYNSGDPDFPFEPLDVGYISYGCSLAESVQVVGESIMWWGVDRSGALHVMKTNGLKAEPVSTPELIFEIYGGRVRGSPDKPDWAMTYSQNGQPIYCLSNDSNTWCYNVFTNKWHKWKSGSTSGRHIARVILTKVQDEYVGGSADSNELLEFETVYTTEDGTSIERILRSNIVHADSNSIVFHALQIDGDAASFMGNTTSNSSGTKLADLYNHTDFTTLGITTGTDYIETSDGTQNIITSVLNAFDLQTAAGSFTEGMRYRIVNGSTGAQIYPETGIDVRWRDSAGAWTTKKERLSDKSGKTRFIWRNLGQSHSRTFEISTSVNTNPVVYGSYVHIEYDDREI